VLVNEYAPTYGLLMYQGLSIFYIGLLVLAVIAIVSVTVVVLYNLFRGQR
jgi:hypothetical protein